MKESEEESNLGWKDDNDRLCELINGIIST